MALRRVWMVSMFSICAQRNAEMSSEGRNDEPVSIQPYLLTSPRKNSERLVPFSHMISERRMNLSSLIVSRPPSPAMMFLVSWNEKQPKCPIEPNGRPL